MADVNKCAHDFCNCAVQEDAEYCSPQCETAAEQDMTGIKCDCGHAGCAGEA